MGETNAIEEEEGGREEHTHLWVAGEDARARRSRDAKAHSKGRRQRRMSTEHGQKLRHIRKRTRADGIGTAKQRRAPEIWRGRGRANATGAGAGAGKETLA